MKKTVLIMSFALLMGIFSGNTVTGRQIWIGSATLQ